MASVGFIRLYCFNVHLDKSVARHIVGDRVKVYFNSRNPQEAVLRRGIPLGTLTSLVPVIVGLVALIWVLKGSG